MKIRCLDCGHSEDVDLDFFVKIIGGATAGFGFWAWVSFLFAGTGFAMAICIAIIVGGGAMLAYKNEIVDWIVNKQYECTGCGGQRWAAVSPDVEQEINAQRKKIAELEIKTESLKDDLANKQKQTYDYIKRQYSFVSEQEVDELLEEIEDKDSKIKNLTKDNKESKNFIESLRTAQEKVFANLKEELSTYYPSLVFDNRAIKSIAKLAKSKRQKLGYKLGLLNYNPEKVKIRDDIEGTNIKELEFGDGGRIYIRKEDSHFIVVCVGNKNSQNTDLKQLKREQKNLQELKGKVQFRDDYDHKAMREMQ